MDRTAKMTLGRVALVLAFLAIWCHPGCYAQSDRAAPPLDKDFKEKAFEHVRRLAALGVRTPGSENDRRAIGYVKEQMEGMALAVSIEPFEFESFSLEKAILTVGHKRAEPTLLAFNPYTRAAKIKGQAVFVEAESMGRGGAMTRLDLHDKIVVTKNGANFWRLAAEKPRVIVFLSSSDFDSLKTSTGAQAQVNARGRLVKIKSANVVGALRGRADTQKEIIISAHLDSIGGPGADDNASGVGVLLELARYFSNQRTQIPMRLKFVTFGAEELGFVGSRIYLQGHQDELGDCQLVFNLDSVGGPKDTYVELRGGIESVSSRKAHSQLSANLVNKATQSSDGKWRLLHPDVLLFASNVPQELRTLILRTAEELHYEIKPGYQMGSDHLMFAQAGIVATDIAISGNQHHSVLDIPERVRLESLQRCGQIVTRVVWGILNRF